MLVTDHDSYGGYEAYVNAGKKYNDFVVLRELSTTVLSLDIL